MAPLNDPARPRPRTTVATATLFHSLIVTLTASMATPVATPAAVPCPGTGAARPERQLERVKNRAHRTKTDPPATIRRSIATMGTILTVILAAEDRTTAVAASETAVAAVMEAEQRLSTWSNSSELSQLNRYPAGRRKAVSPALLADLETARHWWRVTDGAFDPGCGSLLAAWGMRGRPRRPTPAELAAATDAAGFRHLKLGRGWAERRHAGLVLEEGGFGKGIALDLALASVRRHPVAWAVLDLGGQLMVSGTAVEIAVADPRNRNAEAVTLRIPSGSLATSGNSERGVKLDELHIGHILDPRTGLPAFDFGSITVWTAEATAADALSTGLFVLGPDRALAWAEENDGVELLILEVLGPQLRGRATSGMIPLIVDGAPGVHLDHSPRIRDSNLTRHHTLQQGGGRCAERSTRHVESVNPTPCHSPCPPRSDDRGCRRRANGPGRPGR